VQKSAHGADQSLELRRGFYILKIKEGKAVQNLKAFVL